MQKFNDNWAISKKLYAIEKDSLSITKMGGNDGYPPSYFTMLNYIAIGRKNSEDYIAEGCFMFPSFQPDEDKINDYTYLDLLNMNNYYTMNLYANYKIFYDGTFWMAKKTTIPNLQEKYDKLHPLLINVLRTNGDLLTEDYDYWYTLR